LAQLDLQAADVAAQGGLGQAQHLGAPGKAGLLGHGHKRLQLLEVHIDILDITNYLIFKKRISDSAPVVHVCVLRSFTMAP
jgi:hypothetical protein